MRKYLPIIMGLLLGVISIIVGQIPNGIRQFTGLTIIGNHIGYILGALIVAWVYAKNWVKSFLLSSFMLTIANFTYYAFIFAFNLLIVQTESHMSNLIGLISWLAISVAVSAMAATAIWLVRHLKSKLLCYGIFAMVYLGLLGVIYLYKVRFIINWYGASRVGDFFEAWRFAGYIFEIVFAVAITTVVVAVGLRQLSKEDYMV